MMLPAKHISDIAEACAFERVMGSKVLNSMAIYGADDSSHRFFLATTSGQPTAAMYLSGGLLLMPTNGGINMDELVSFIREHGVTEMDTSYATAAAAHGILGGHMESSYYMVYNGGDLADIIDIRPCEDMRDVYGILQQSHEYYRAHLQYEPWSQDLQSRIDHGFAELYQLDMDGEPAGTGSIISSDDECGAVAAVAVVPKHRHKGLGLSISKFLTRRILDMGKTPRLISGYDAVAELYRQIGYVEAGRWGELYL